MGRVLETQGEAAVVRGRAWVRHQWRSEMGMLGAGMWLWGQKCNHGDKDMAMGTEMGPLGQRQYNGKRMGPQWQKWGSVGIKDGTENR